MSKQPTITILSADGRQCQIPVTDPIAFFQQNCEFLYDQAARNFGLTPGSIIITYAGKHLERGTPMTSYGITKGSHLNCAGTVPGGKL